MMSETAEILITVFSTLYGFSCIAFFFVAVWEWYYFDTLNEIFIDKFNIAPSIRFWGLIFYGLTVLLSFVFGGVILLIYYVGIPIGKVTYIGIYWIIFGRAYWEEEVMAK